MSKEVRAHIMHCGLTSNFFKSNWTGRVVFSAIEFWDQWVHDPKYQPEPLQPEAVKVQREQKP